MEVQWTLLIFTLLTGGAGWLFACVCADEFLQRASKAALPATVTALVVAIVGGIASVFHLSHADRMLAALNHPTSGIFIEAVLVGLFCLFAIIYLVLLVRGIGGGARKAMAIIAAIAGVVLSFAAGASYMMEAQYTWDTPLLPLAYCGTAVPLGIAAYLTVAEAVKALEEPAPYDKALLVGGVIGLVTVAAYVLVAGVAGEEPVLFLVALVGSGVVPIVAGVLMAKQPSSALTWSAVALVCACVGAACLRALMWLVSSVPANFFSNLF